MTTHTRTDIKNKSRKPASNTLYIRSQRNVTTKTKTNLNDAIKVKEALDAIGALRRQVFSKLGHQVDAAGSIYIVSNLVADLFASTPVFGIGCHSFSAQFFVLFCRWQHLLLEQ